MPSTYTSLLRIQEQANGENNNTWGTITNTNFTLFENAITGLVTITCSVADTSLTTNNGSTDQERYAILELNGAPSSGISVVIPNGLVKHYLVKSSVTNSNDVTVKYDGGTGVSVAPGTTVHLLGAGTTVTRVSPPLAATGVSAATYGSSTLIPSFIVSSNGLITSATQVTVGVSASAGAGVSVTQSGAHFVVAVANTSVTAGSYIMPALAVDARGQITSISNSKYVVQVTAATPFTSYLAVGAGGIAVNDTLPQVTSGTALCSVNVVPTTTTSRFRISAGGSAMGSSVDTSMILAVFRDGSSSALAVSMAGTGNGTPGYIALETVVSANVNTTVTFTSRMGSVIGTTYLNGNSSARLFGGGLGWTLVVEEFKE